MGQTLSTNDTIGLIVGLSCGLILIISLWLWSRYHKPGKIGSIWLITGASTGIGFSTTMKMAKEGYVVYAGVRKEADGERLKAENVNIKHPKGKIIPVIIDVTKRDQIESCVATLTEATKNNEAGFGGVLHNAGIGDYSSCLNEETIRQTFEINFFGVVMITRACFDLLREHKARVVVIASVAAEAVVTGLGSYCASKHAVKALTYCMRQELWSHDIRAVLVKPGFVKTPILDKATKLVFSDFDMKWFPWLPFANRIFVKLGNSTGGPSSIAAWTIYRACTTYFPATAYSTGNAGMLLPFMATYLPTKFLEFPFRLLAGLKKFHKFPKADETTAETEKAELANNAV